MKTSAVLLIAWLLAIVPTSQASISGFQEISIDFTNEKDAVTKATWSNPDNLNVSKDGLGWDGDDAASRDGWIQTTPVATGLSWRPAYSISVRVTIQPPSSEITLNSGQKYTPYSGDVYVRYSPDRVHWSSWQVLQKTEAQSSEEEKKPGLYYSGTVRVPNLERNEYNKLLSDYSRLDVPWKSDEEAAVQWILARDPEFFSKHLPFVGYVEFLYEKAFHGGKRIQSFRASIGYGIGGMHSAPKDASAYEDRNVPWRFIAKGAGNVGTIAPVDRDSLGH